MRPFCSNPMCLANKELVPDEETHLEGKLNNGLDISLGRALAVSEKHKVKVPFCSSCANVFSVVRGDEAPAHVGTDGMGAFCSNRECFTHNMEVPEDQDWLELSMGGSVSRRMDREWLVMENGSQEPFCSACSNIFNIILGDPEYPDNDEGFDSDVRQVLAE